MAATVVGVFALAGVALAISSGSDDDTTSSPPATSDGEDGARRSSGGGEIDLAGVDACSLIDEATVQRLTGETTPFVTQDLSGNKCFWGSTRPGVGAYVELDMFRQPDGLSATRSISARSVRSRHRAPSATRPRSSSVPPGAVRRNRRCNYAHSNGARSSPSSSTMRAGRWRRASSPELSGRSSLGSSSPRPLVIQPARQPLLGRVNPRMQADTALTASRSPRS